MYTEIGLNLSLREEHILGVFDLDNTSWSKITRNFLHTAQENGEVVEATDSLPKSFVLAQQYGQNRVYLTKSNSAVLQKKLQREEETNR